MNRKEFINLILDKRSLNKEVYDLSLKVDNFPYARQVLNKIWGNINLDLILKSNKIIDINNAKGDLIANTINFINDSRLKSETKRFIEDLVDQKILGSNFENIEITNHENKKNKRTKQIKNTSKSNNSNEEKIKSLMQEIEYLRKNNEINSLKAEIKSLQISKSPNIDEELSIEEIDELRSRRTSIGIFGIIFGFLGVHKFMLGYTREGFLLLAVSIVGGIVTCGSAIIITDIIGIIEGIMILNKTPREFKKTYIDRKTTWFQ